MGATHHNHEVKFIFLYIYIYNKKITMAHLFDVADLNPKVTGSSPAQSLAASSNPSWVSQLFFFFPLTIRGHARNYSITT